MRCKHCGKVTFAWFLTFKYGLAPVCFNCVTYRQKAIGVASKIPVSKKIVDRTRKMIRKDIKLGKEDE